MSTGSNKFKAALHELRLFLSSGFVLKQLGGWVAFLVAFFFMTGWFLKCYTRHGESRSVPSLLAMPLDEAIKAAKRRGMKVVVIDSSQYHEDKAPLEVLEQNPKPGARVKPKRTVYLSINAAGARPMPFPYYSSGESLYGKNVKLVERVLGQNDLKLKIVGYRPDKAVETVLEFIYNGDTITEQLRRGKEVLVQQYATIEVIVAEEPTGNVPVPRLVCKTYGEAAFMITSLGLNLGSVIINEPLPDTSRAYVYQQVPAFAESITMRLGEQVDLFLSSAQPEACANEVDDWDGELGF